MVAPVAAGAARAGASRAAAGRAGAAPRARSISGILPSGGGKSKGGAATGGMRLLIAEWLICVVVLALSPLGKGEDETTPRQWMRRGSAISGLFVVLGLVAAIGPKAAKAAAAFGGIVAVTVLIDQSGLFGILAQKFNSTDPGPRAGVGPVDPGPPSAGGTVDPTTPTTPTPTPNPPSTGRADPEEFMRRWQAARPRAIQAAVTR